MFSALEFSRKLLHLHALQGAMVRTGLGCLVQHLLSRLSCGMCCLFSVDCLVKFPKATSLETFVQTVWNQPIWEECTAFSLGTKYYGELENLVEEGESGFWILSERSRVKSLLIRHLVCVPSVCQVMWQAFSMRRQAVSSAAFAGPRI